MQSSQRRSLRLIRQTKLNFLTFSNHGKQCTEPCCREISPKKAIVNLSSVKSNQPTVSLLRMSDALLETLLDQGSIDVSRVLLPKNPNKPFHNKTQSLQRGGTSDLKAGRKSVVNKRFVRDCKMEKKKKNEVIVVSSDDSEDENHLVLDRSVELSKPRRPRHYRVVNLRQQQKSEYKGDGLEESMVGQRLLVDQSMKRMRGRPSKTKDVQDEPKSKSKGEYSEYSMLDSSTPVCRKLRMSKRKSQRLEVDQVVSDQNKKRKRGRPRKTKDIQDKPESKSKGEYSDVSWKTKDVQDDGDSGDDEATIESLKCASLTLFKSLRKNLGNISSLFSSESEARKIIPNFDNVISIESSSSSSESSNGEPYDVFTRIDGSKRGSSKWWNDADKESETQDLKSREGESGIGDISECESVSYVSSPGMSKDRDITCLNSQSIESEESNPMNEGIVGVLESSDVQRSFIPSGCSNSEYPNRVTERMLQPRSPTRQIQDSPDHQKSSCPTIQIPIIPASEQPSSPIGQISNSSDPHQSAQLPCRQYPQQNDSPTFPASQQPSSPTGQISNMPVSQMNNSSNGQLSHSPEPQLFSSPTSQLPNSPEPPQTSSPNGPNFLCDQLLSPSKHNSANPTDEDCHNESSLDFVSSEGQMGVVEVEISNYEKITGSCLPSTLQEKLPEQPTDSPADIDKSLEQSYSPNVNPYDNSSNSSSVVAARGLVTPFEELIYDDEQEHVTHSFNTDTPKKINFELLSSPLSSGYNNNRRNDLVIDENDEIPLNPIMDEDEPKRVAEEPVKMCDSVTCIPSDEESVVPSDQSGQWKPERPVKRHSGGFVRRKLMDELKESVYVRNDDFPRAFGDVEAGSSSETLRLANGAVFNQPTEPANGIPVANQVIFDPAGELIAHVNSYPDANTSTGYVPASFPTYNANPSAQPGDLNSSFLMSQQETIPQPPVSTVEYHDPSNGTIYLLVVPTSNPTYYQ